MTSLSFINAPGTIKCPSHTHFLLFFTYCNITIIEKYITKLNNQKLTSAE